MKLHEYQAKQLFASVQIPIPRGIMAKDPQQASSGYQALAQQCQTENLICTVKAQLHAGGRGKAGGILVARSAEEAASHAESLLGKRLVTQQTSAEGLPATCVLLEERIRVSREMYLALTIDRSQARLVLLGSVRGGVDIEDVASTEPSQILHEHLDVLDGPREENSHRIISALELEGPLARSCQDTIHALWKLFILSDASLIEINPLVVTEDEQLLALDAKMLLDDNALFRHLDLAVLRDEKQEHPLELKAARIGISYVELSGNIGCLVNGAGLAMATNDIIKLSGGEPANFLDVGGGANVEQVTQAFSIILSDPRVSAILVNIFGGIMRCDWIAQGLLKATEQLQVKIPIVVRLQGTSVEEGRRLLSQSQSLNLISVDELAEASRRVVELAKRK